MNFDKAALTCGSCLKMVADTVNTPAKEIEKLEVIGAVPVLFGKASFAAAIADSSLFGECANPPYCQIIQKSQWGEFLSDPFVCCLQFHL